ncbi:MAG: amidase [Alphaproteobacteria bacterium]|nr:amidase [Alphaproteobacteria bacterium]
MSKPIWQWSASEIAAAVRGKKIAASEVAEAAVARMRAANPAINAVTRDTGDTAMTRARAIDAALAAGIDPGPLAGVPVTIKDNVDVEGQSSPNGIPALNDIKAPANSPVVDNLLNAGAVIIGRTNTPEFSLRAFTDNPLFGPTKNPWNPAVTCGGSSGGAGAGLAAGIGALAHGNDIGGSLRFPAYCNGVATIRPTFGRVPAYLPSAVAERPLMAQLLSVQGPLARHVDDLRVGLAVMAARSPLDPWWVPAPLEFPRPVKPIRVALAKASPFDRAVHPAVLHALDRAAGILEKSGYAIIEREAPDLRRVGELWMDLMVTEIESLQRPIVNQMGSGKIRFFLDALKRRSQVLPREGYMAGQMERTALLRKWMLFFEETPLLLSPMSILPPFPVDLDVRDDEGADEVIDCLGYSVAMNLLGLPAAIAPTSLHDGAPIGVQLSAARFREDLCLDAAEAIERDVGLLTERLWAREAV